MATYNDTPPPVYSLAVPPMAVYSPQDYVVDQATPRVEFIDPKWRGIVAPKSTSHPVLHCPGVFLPPLLGSPPRLSTPNRSRTDRSVSVRSRSRSKHGDGSDAGVNARPRSTWEKETVGLDRFASAYVPEWLRNLPPPHHLQSLPAAPIFPPPGYNPPLTSPLIQVKSIPLSDVFPSILSINFPETSMRPFDDIKASHNALYYARHFSTLLALHLKQQLIEMDQAVLFNVPIPVAGVTNDTYRITIPGIREDSPKLAIGDRLLFRGLFESEFTGSKAEVEGEVVGIIKSKGRVFVHAPFLGVLDQMLPRARQSKSIGQGAKATSGEPEEGLPAPYQVRFMLNSSAVCTMQDGVRKMAWALENDLRSARSWLFPEQKDVRREPMTPRKIQWIDGGLNDEQKGAVADIVNRRHEVPYLISGPPGTGKTKTLVEAVLQILAHNPYASILVCAPSNPAADTLTRRLAKILDHTTLFRLNAPSRTFAEVPDNLLSFCEINGTSFGLPSVDKLLSFRVVVSTCIDADILNQIRVNNWFSMGMEWEMHKKLHPRSHNVVPMFPHWTHLLIDEAAQASEPETLVPLSVVLPYVVDPACPIIDIAVVFCGDIHQLGPVISSREARDFGLDVSLLERLFEREVYRDHPRARKSIRQRHKAEQYPAPFANLVQNYRSIGPILMIPASLFYDDSLQASANDVQLVRWSGLPNPKIPILFAGTETEEDWIEEGASWFNAGEIVKTVDMVRSILNEIADFRQKDIAVITPWREQVWRIRLALRKAGFAGVDVGNVETYQGGEFRVTILSCVRSRERFLEDDRLHNMGLYNEPKRFNVAITRAKELLVIIGNANLLQRDPYWNGLLQIALRNNLYKGPNLVMERTDAYTSAIERQTRGENIAVDDEMIFVVDSVARHTLRDE